MFVLSINIKPMKNYLNHSDCSNCDIFNNGFFSHNSAEAKKWFGNDNCRQLIYQKGETVVKQGAFASHLLYIKTGLVKIVIEGESGKNIIIDFLKSGSFVGLPAVIGEEYYPFTINTLKPSDICLIKKDRFNEFLETKPETFIKLQELNNKIYKHLFEKIAVVGTKQMHGRLAHALLYLNEEELYSEDIFSFITRKDIAEFVGMSSESMVRLLNEFKADKLITIKGKKIIVTDKEMLARLYRVG